ncbi:MAG: hypothetical protein AB1571_03960 [Nanoarchaeota archaeon]
MNKKGVSETAKIIVILILLILLGFVMYEIIIKNIVGRLIQSVT